MKSLTFLIILLFIIQELVLAQPNPPMTFGESVDFAIEKLKTDGVISLHTGIRPLTRLEIVQALEQAQTRIDAGLVELSGIDLNLFKKLKSEFSKDKLGGFRINALPYSNTSILLTSNEQDATFSPSAKVALRYEKGDDFILHQEFEICRGENKYPPEGKTASQRLHLWQWNYTADFTRVYLSFALSKFNVLVGRDKLFWGPTYRDALGISDNSPPFDLVLLSGKFGPVKAQSFMAKLDQMWHDRYTSNSYRYLADRYLAGHRIDYKLANRLEFAVSEIVLYGGDRRGIEWEYLNPTLPYYASQYNADWDDNVMFLFDIETIPVNGVRLYSSALIDDFQYSGDKPDAWGVMLGCHLSGLQLDRTDLRIQYTRLNRWIYTHRVVENQYTHFGSIIGHRLGNDSDELQFELSNYLNVDTRVKFNYIFTRQGAANVEDSYGGKDYQQLKKFPKRKNHEFGIQFLYEPIESWQINLQFQYLIWQTYTEIEYSTHRKSQIELFTHRGNQFEFTIGYRVNGLTIDD